MPNRSSHDAVAGSSARAACGPGCPKRDTTAPVSSGDASRTVATTIGDNRIWRHSPHHPPARGPLGRSRDQAAPQVPPPAS
jgi:hypothetical protein